MPTDPIQDPAANQAGKQESQGPQGASGPVINDVISDDFGGRYLLGRQLAHEFHSPVIQTLIRHGVDPQQLSESAMAVGQDPQKKTAMKPQAPQSASEEFGKTIEPPEQAALQDPLIDPTSAAAGGFGAMTKISLSAGMKLMPSLGRGLASGVVGGLADYPVGAAAEMADKKVPGAGLPFSVLVGMVSGVTLERAIEQSVIRLSGATGEAASKLTQRVIKELESGDAASVIGKKIKDEIDGLPEFFGGKESDIPSDWKQIAKELFSSQAGAVYLEGAKKQPSSGVPSTTKTIGGSVEATNFDADIDRKYAGNINLTKIIQEPEDIQKIIAGTADQFPDEIQKARRGKVSWEQTEEDSAKYGLEDLLGRKLGQAYNDAEVENARTLLVSSSENLKALRDKIMLQDATDQDKADFLSAFNMHYAIEMQVAGAAAEAGRALRAFGKVAQSNALKTKQLKETLQQGVGKFSADQIAEMMVGMDSVNQITKFVDQAQRATSLDMLTEAWINGLLSGPTTHAVNTFSNTLTALWQIPERAFAAGISKTLGTEGGVKFGEVNSQAWGFIQGAKDGFRTAAKVMRTGEPLDQMDKIESRRFRAITAKNVQNLPVIKKLAPNAIKQGGMVASGIDAIGEAIRVPGRFLGAEDEFFKSVGYRMELQARAYRDAANSGKEGDELAEHIARVVADPEKEAPDIHLAAIDAARYQTFTKDLGEAGKHFQKFVSKAPALRFIIPFMRTPTNIVKFAGERSPVAWISKGVRDELAAGGARRDLALAKMGMGTMAMTVVGAMAAQGMVTGGGPSDPKEMSAWRRTGWQPYSVKIGDKYVSYSRVEPIGMLFGLAADFVNIAGLADESMQPEMDKLAGAILSSLSKNVTSKTWLEGVSSAIEAFDDPDRYMGRFVQGYARSGIPLSSLVGTVERTVDPEMEAIYSMMDAVKSRIPGLSSDMPKRRDIWGRKLSTAVSDNRSWAEIAASAGNPFYISKDRATPIDNELIRLGSPISKPRRLQSFDGVAYEMTPKEYDDFIVNMNTAKLAATGKNLKDSLNDLVSKDPNYKTLNDDMKASIVRRYFNNAKQEARMKTREQHPVMHRVIEKIKFQKMMEMSR